MDNAGVPAPVRDWKAWFDSRDSATVVNQKAQEQLLQTFDASISRDECQTKIGAHQDTAFMFHENFGSARIAVFHHFQTIGGTVYDNNMIHGCIQGIEPEMTANVTPDVEILCRKPAGAPAQVPTTTSLFGIKKVEDIDTVVVGARSTYQPRNFIPIVPFLVPTVSNTITTTNGAAKEVYLACTKEIVKFDHEHAGDTNYNDKAKVKCKDLLQWLYLVATQSQAVEKIPTTGCNSITMVTMLNGITKICIGKKVGSPKRTREVSPVTTADFKEPLEILAASATSNQDYLRKLTQMQEKNQDKTSKSFSKLPSKYKNMILVASSTSEVTMVTVNPQAKEFYASASLLHANIFLNSVLEAAQIECSISNAMTTSIWHGSLLWVNSVTPSGLACSVITSDDFMKTDTLHEGLVLDYATKFEMSDKAIEKLTRTQVRFPNDIEDTLERIRALHAICQLLFGKCSLPAQGLKGLINKCRDNKRMLKATHHMDNEFIPKFMCAIDHRLYQWLQQCSMVTTVDETSIALLTFASLFDDVMMHRFYYILPLSVKRVKGKKIEDDTGDNERDRKRSKQVEYIRNHNVPPEWKLRQGEQWDTVFRNKTMGGPTLSCGSKFCLKFWVKGICYADCKQKESHKPLNDEDKAAGGTFVKELRGE